MHILVTGGTGRIGSRLVSRLLERGHSVSMLVRQPERVNLIKNQGANLVIGDLLLPDSYSHALTGIDAIIHLAAFFRGATPDETTAVNLESTIVLAKAAMQADVSRFVFASTNLVYGPGNHELFDEESPLNPAAPYPKTKAAAEKALLELYREDGLGLRILRLAFVYGEEDPHLTEGMTWFRKWNPLQQIHMVHHADVAQAVILATESAGIDGQIYNVADNEPVTATEIMQLYNEVSAEEANNRAIDPGWLQLVSTRKIRERLGYKPLYPALRDAVAANVL
jgi:nucleoside-diphosphate-sugar epimerase